MSYGRSRTRLFVAGIGALSALLLSGCLQPGQSLYKSDIEYDLPGIKQGNQTIARVACKFQNASVNAPQYLDIRCYAVLSNGMTDLAHDVRTIADAPWVDDSRIEDIVRGQAKSRCRSAVASGGHRVADQIPHPFWKAVAHAYFSNATVLDDISNDCGTIATKAWGELNDNTYSTGHKCLAVGGTLHVDSVNHGPHLQSLSAFAIHETSTGYPG